MQQEVFLVVREWKPTGCPMNHVTIHLSEESARRELHRGPLTEGRSYLCKATVLEERDVDAEPGKGGD
ncbi:hypothetical protein CMI37_33370 [Candidatus Pacearchaeota archaeon]|nr:hypothetical protein [Candidatus Pacearchaeota archaeon]|tara:strand:- start:938 stop:1141 length:204 start_codon:yes stop_codon:yes gene_type:complete